jgi:hypothetical protein
MRGACWSSMGLAPSYLRAERRNRAKMHHGLPGCRAPVLARGRLMNDAAKGGEPQPRRPPCDDQLHLDLLHRRNRLSSTRHHGLPNDPTDRSWRSRIVLYRQRSGEICRRLRRALETASSMSAAHRCSRLGVRDRVSSRYAPCGGSAPNSIIPSVARILVVELSGLEPLTSWVRCWRSVE